MESYPQHVLIKLFGGVFKFYIGEICNHIIVSLLLYLKNILSDIVLPSLPYGPHCDCTASCINLNSHMFLEINYVCENFIMVLRFISSIYHHNEYDIYS
jgi:hypothetical protein